MASNSSIRVVCDAGPIIHLDELNCLDLLTDFAVLIPGRVWQEIALYRPSALDQSPIQLTRIEVSLPEDIEFVTLIRAFALDAGEQEALALMHQRPDAILLTDDAAARLVAEQMGMPVHGTIGILLRAIRRELRTPHQVLSLLQVLPQQSTLYVRPSLLRAISTRVQSEFGIE
jgi:predicted nucleic acid-binding protein